MKSPPAAGAAAGAAGVDAVSVPVLAAGAPKEKPEAAAGGLDAAAASVAGCSAGFPKRDGVEDVALRTHGFLASYESNYENTHAGVPNEMAGAFGAELASAVVDEVVCV